MPSASTIACCIWSVSIPAAVTLLPDARTALETGLYGLWGAETAVKKLSAMAERYLQISDRNCKHSVAVTAWRQVVRG